MDRMEMAEKLTEKANITLAEAKEVLERTNWDMLEAMILLEREGKTRTHAATASSDSGEKDYETVHATASARHEERRERARSFGQSIRDLLRKGMENDFVVTKDGTERLSIPVLLMAVLMLPLFTLITLLLIVGLFCGCHYSFRGKELGTESINSGMEKVSDVAEQVKAAVQKDE